MDMPETTHNQPEYSVSEISGKLKRVVEGQFGYVRVRGEISGYKRAASGHLYLDLKDENAVIAGVCWRGKAASLAFKPEDGLEVIVSGKISTYPGSSKYQIIIDRMEPAGAGALMALLEQRKKALAAEGLFAPERKKSLPFMPQTIGVITSPTGAVIRDILHRLSERFPTQVLLWPVRVQGDGAAEEIVAAIEGFNRLARQAESSRQLTAPELLIVARGGGSIEDLWCFNEEAVVRAAAASVIPLISAVGHETDITLIDHAADKRAPTPTAAAEIAVPVRHEWIVTLGEWQSRLNRSMHLRLTHAAEQVHHLSRALPTPMQLFDARLQRLDDWSERLAAILPRRVERLKEQLSQLETRLSGPFMLRRITQHEEALNQLYQRLNRATRQRLDHKRQALQLQEKLLHSLNYQQTLKRGFVLIKGPDNKLITDAEHAKNQTELQLVFADGTIKAKPKNAAASTAKKSAPKARPKQETLF